MGHRPTLPVDKKIAWFIDPEKPIVLIDDLEGEVSCRLGKVILIQGEADGVPDLNRKIGKTGLTISGDPAQGDLLLPVGRCQIGEATSQIMH